MEFALRRAEDIAASASFLISADTKNLSDASISADSTGTIQDTALSKVDSVFTNSLSPISATTFLMTDLLPQYRKQWKVYSLQALQNSHLYNYIIFE